MNPTNKRIITTTIPTTAVDFFRVEDFVELVVVELLNSNPGIESFS